MRRTLAAVSVAVLALTACSSSSGGGPALTDKFGLTQAGAARSLLKGSQLPHGFAQRKGDQTELPHPCTPKATPATELVHPRAASRVTFEDPLGTFQITEIVTNYPGAASTKQVAQAVVTGLGCETGYISNFAVTITGPSELTKLGVKTDGAESWSLKAPSSEQVVILAQLGTNLVQLLFASTGAVRGGVDPSAIAKQAIANVRSTVDS